MKRKFIICVLIWLLFILQTSVFRRLDLIAVAPNLLLILTVSIGFMQGRSEGIMTGFAAGLLIDLSYGDLVGFHALLYLWVGFFCGRYRDIFCDEDIKVPLLLVGGCDIAYNTAIYAARFLMRGRLEFGYYARHVILPEAVWTVLIAIVLYRLIYLLNHALVEKEKEGRQSLWIRD